MKDRLGNMQNYRAMPFIESYVATLHSQVVEDGKKSYDEIGQKFRYADGTSDSYVKRGFDEEFVQRITRREGLEQSYRILTSDATVDVKPGDKVMIGDRPMFVRKVLPLLNTNDTIRMYNIDANLYRDMAIKLIYMD